MTVAWLLAEHTQAYEILAAMLKSKADHISSELLQIIWQLCCQHSADSLATIVANVLAFRYIACDFGLWSACPVEVQRAHLQLIKELVEHNVEAEFNLRRLSKLRECRDRVRLIRKPAHKL